MICYDLIIAVYGDNSQVNISDIGYIKSVDLSPIIGYGTKKITKNKEKSFKNRILECLGNEKPYPWGRSIGLSDGALGRIFAENKIPSTKYLVMISEKLGKSINWLLTGKEHPLDKNSRIISYLSSCSSEEHYLMDKLIEIFRNDDETHKEALMHNTTCFVVTNYGQGWDGQKGVRNICLSKEFRRDGLRYMIMEMETGLDLLKVFLVEACLFPIIRESIYVNV